VGQVIMLALGVLNEIIWKIGQMSVLPKNQLFLHFSGQTVE